MGGGTRLRWHDQGVRGAARAAGDAAAARGPGGEVVATVVEKPGAGGSVRIFANGRPRGPSTPGSRGAVRDTALEALPRETSTTVTFDAGAGPASVFLEVFPRQPRLIIFGGVHIAVALVPLARALGYRTIVADGRAAFLTPARFPGADQLILGWPEAAFEQIGLDASCYVCVLSHNPKFHEPALRARAPLPRALHRRDRLAKDSGPPAAPAQILGFSETDVARIHGPIGLALGGRHPAETALAILAEMTAVRYGGAAARS